MLMLPVAGVLSVIAMPQTIRHISVWKGVVSHIAETQVAWEQLQTGNGHVVAVSFLRDDGPEEVHALQAEILVAQGGEATLVLGATCGGSNEVKRDGVNSVPKESHLTQGDIVDIPPDCRHQLRIIPGGYFIYTTIRIDSHRSAGTD
jgi:hypothetical protein